MHSGFWRELILRGGLTLTIALIAYVLLDAAPWIFGLPVAVSALVLLKWRMRWIEKEEDEDEDATAANR